MDFFYSNKIRLILLTKYNHNSIYDLSSIREINLSLNFDTRKVEAMAALSILTNNSKHFYLDSSKSSNKSIYSKTGSGLVHFLLRKEQILFFINKLVHIYLPRIRYFKGFTIRNFQNNGNFSHVFDDLLIFPELEEEMEIFYKLVKLNLQVVLDKNISAQRGRFLFWSLGFPFNFG